MAHTAQFEGSDTDKALRMCRALTEVEIEYRLRGEGEAADKIKDALMSLPFGSLARLYDIVREA